MDETAGRTTAGEGNPKPRFHQRQTPRAVAVFFVIWAGCVGFLAATGGNFLFPISSLVLFGVVLTGLALLLTRKTDAPPVPVSRPKPESLLVLGYLVVYALVLFGPVSGLVKKSFSPGPVQELVVLAYKLVVHLLVPALLIRTVHGHIEGIFDIGLQRRGVATTLVLFSGVMIVLVALLNSLFEELAGSGLSTAETIGWVSAAWLWMSLEAGITEEFLFRGLLQSRLTAWIGSAPMAIVLAAVVFALVHVPSFWLRGGDAIAEQASGLPQVIALSVAALGPIAVMLGTLWHRTRSFALVVLVHGAIDAMPHVEEMIRIWSW